jgi:Fe2+ transport system protein FeoA
MPQANHHNFLAMLYFSSHDRSLNFSFLGGSLEREALINDEPERSQETALLCHGVVGERYCVNAIRGSTEDTHYLCLIGIRPGVHVEIINRRLSGSVVVSIHDRQVGIGQQLAQQILVSRAI